MPKILETYLEKLETDRDLALASYEAAEARYNYHLGLARYTPGKKQTIEQLRESSTARGLLDEDAKMMIKAHKKVNQLDLKIEFIKIFTG